MRDIILVRQCAGILSRYYDECKNEEKLLKILQYVETLCRSDKNMLTDSELRDITFKSLLDMYEFYSSNHPKIKKQFCRIKKEAESLGEIEYVEQRSDDDCNLNNALPIAEAFGKQYTQIVFGLGEKYSLLKVLQRITIVALPFAVIEEEESQQINKPTYLGYEHYYTLEPFGLLDYVDTNPETFYDSYECANMYSCIASPYIFDNLFKRYSYESIIDHFNNVLFFTDSAKVHLEKALTHYLEEDYRVAYHLLLPLIEDNIRALAKLSGCDIYTFSRQIDPEYKSLSKILDEYNAIELNFKTSFQHTNNLAMSFLKTILILRTSLNLRNKFAHGIDLHLSGKRRYSDILLQVMILLSFAKKLY